MIYTLEFSSDGNVTIYRPALPEPIGPIYNKYTYKNGKINFYKMIDEFYGDNDITITDANHFIMTRLMDDYGLYQKTVYYLTRCI